MKISVIVPIYNVEEFIGQCARSLFSQDWEDSEFIFVDDGSPDRSVEIIQEILESFPKRISQVTILHQKNSGLPQARMTGLLHATGDYVIHVDSDDWVEPNYLSSLAGKAIETSADVVYCDFYKEYTTKPAKIYREEDVTPPDGPSAVRAMHKNHLKAYMWNKLIRRSLYRLDDIFVPIHSFHEDLIFQTQLLYDASLCVHIKEPLYHYRRKRGGALTSGHVFIHRRDSAENLLALYKALPKDGGPLTICGDDILWRAAKYCIKTFDFKLLSSCPEAVDILKNRIFTVWKTKEA